MNYKNVSESLRRIANKTLTQDDLAHQIIIQKGNTYQAFSTYSIEETPFGWEVSADILNDAIFFNTAKVALAWCITHKARQYKMAETMRLLDSRIIAKQFDIDMLTHMLDNITESDKRAILVARLMEDINSRQTYKKQLAKCLESAKYIQIKGTSPHEFNRLNKTSRRNNSR